jgi:RNA polymerase sigma-70 factor (ECF subfamily)
MNEQTTLTAIKNGNIKAFEELFRSLYPPLCGYGLKILKDSNLAEEIVQEVFYQLWKKKEDLHITGSLNSYLYKAVYNRCLSYIEHKQVENKYASNMMLTNSNIYSVNDAMQTGEVYRIYKNTLNQLPHRCRKIFQMNRDFGLKYHEIAEKLSISVKTVESDMGKALKAFRHSLSEYK